MGWAAGFDTGTRAAKQWIDSYDASQQEIDAKKIYDTKVQETPTLADLTDADRQRFDQYNAGIAAQDNAVFGDGTATADDMRYGLQNQKQVTRYSLGDPERGGLRQDTQFTPAQLNAWRAGQLADSMARNGNLDGSMKMRLSQQALEKGGLDMQVGQLGLKSATRADATAQRVDDINKRYGLIGADNAAMTKYFTDQYDNNEGAFGEGEHAGYAVGHAPTKDGILAWKKDPVTGEAVDNGRHILYSDMRTRLQQNHLAELAAADPGTYMKTALAHDVSLRDIEMKAQQHAALMKRYDEDRVTRKDIADDNNQTQIRAANIHAGALRDRKQDLNPLQQAQTDDILAFRKGKQAIIADLETGKIDMKAAQHKISILGMKFGGAGVRDERPAISLKDRLDATKYVTETYAAEIDKLRDPMEKKAFVARGVAELLGAEGGDPYAGAADALFGGGAQAPKSPPSQDGARYSWSGRRLSTDPDADRVGSEVGLAAAFTRGLRNMPGMR